MPKLPPEPARRHVRSSAAKLNLFLYVTGRRADGYHELNSYFARLNLADQITCTRLPEGSLPGYDPLGSPALPLRLTTNDPHLPSDRRNLIVRAAETLFAGVGQRAGAQPVEINLEKHIPLGGGLGGGSSNAAVTLLILNQMWEANLSLGELALLAGSIGSDVPFFLGPAQTLVTGRGEFLQPITPPWPFHAVLICPPFACATAGVYQAFAAGTREKLPRELLTPHDFWSAEGHPVKPSVLAPRLVNMLWPAALQVQPALADISARAGKLCSRPVHLTGSGSTLFVLADDGEDAENLAGALAPLQTRQCRLIRTAGSD